MNDPTLAGLLHVTADACHVADPPVEEEDRELLRNAIEVAAADLADLAGRIDPCISVPDGFGWCPGCGARLAVPHRRGGDGCVRGLALPIAAALAAWRRLRVRLEVLTARADVGPIASSPDGVASQPSAAAGAGRAPSPSGPGRAVHPEVEQ